MSIGKELLDNIKNDNFYDFNKNAKEHIQNDIDTKRDEYIKNDAFKDFVKSDRFTGSNKDEVTNEKVDFDSVSIKMFKKHGKHKDYKNMITKELEVLKMNKKEIKTVIDKVELIK